MKKISIVLTILIMMLSGCSTSTEQKEEIEAKIAEMGVVKENYSIREDAPIVNRMGETVGRIMINSITPEVTSLSQTAENVINITFTYENFYKEEGLLIDAVPNLEVTDRNGVAMEQVVVQGLATPMTIEPGKSFTAELLYVLPGEENEFMLKYYFDEMRNQASLIFYLEVDEEAEIADDEI